MTNKTNKLIALEKEISEAIKKHYVKKDTTGQVCFAEYCGNCGSGSTSFCPCNEVRRILMRYEDIVAQSAREEERGRIAADFKFHSAFNPSCSCAFIVESLTRND